MPQTAHPLETISAHEAQTINELGERLKTKIIKDNENGIMRRDAHPKMHGLVQAQFTVEPDLPEVLSVGLFSEAKTYPAWIRFSNQSGTIQADSKGDIRGMAIKLMQVSGEKLLEAEKDAQTHDFITISTDVFVTKDVKEFDELIKAVTGNLLQQALFFPLHPRVGLNLYKSMRKFANPLQIRYFSTTPYLLGERAVKYSVIPRIQNKDPIPTNPSDNYLREAMVAQLQNGDAVFDFCIQLQTDPKKMPIEDPGKLWDETLSPFHKVASIKIPSQVFSTPERDELGENLSFTPWHALPEHRPLGGVNRARKVIYDLISTFRHQKNNQPRTEPTGF